MKRGLLILAFGSVILLGGLHQLGIKFYLYWNAIWFDSFMHFLGGFALAAFFLWTFYRSTNINSRVKVMIQILLFTMAAALAWEVFEYYFDIAVPEGENYVSDTIEDVIADFLGGIVATTLGTLKRFHTT